jgi:hypothetical protein
LILYIRFAVLTRANKIFTELAGYGQPEYVKCDQFRRLSTIIPESLLKRMTYSSDWHS